MQVNIEVVQVSDIKHNTKGKGSSYIELTYKDLDKNGQVKGMRLVNFGDYKHLFTEVQALSVGQETTINLEKIKDFWNITAFGEGAQAPVVKDKEVVSVKTDPKQLNTGSTTQKWVPDEVRQRLICRQSSLAQAVAYENASGNAAEIADVLAIADQFFNWVMEQGQGARENAKAKKVQAEVE